MIETAFAQLRFAASMLFGIRLSQRSLDRIIDGMLATRREFGAVGQDARGLTSGPALDEESRRDMQLRRFRRQAARAAGDTAYYEQLFKQIGLDPARLTWEEVQRIPLTPKKDIRDRPGDFVRRDGRPVFRTTTTGTTGWPTSVCFSAYEMSTYIALGAIGLLNEGTVTDEDIAIISTSSRATLGNLCAAGALARIGALVFNGGLVDPALTLALLAERHTIPGKRERVSLMVTYPSYLGQLVEEGQRLGYSPSDFGLRRINVGGEIVTEGLKARARSLFGDAVEFESGYGMTETWPLNGTLCEQGHLHFEPSQGLIEVYNHNTHAPARPGEYGTIVSTPFPPYRETTLVIRYDTQDVVRVLDAPLTCRMRNQPAVSNAQGKLKLSVRHDDGWTFPRDVMEALEGEALAEEVPLPARFSFRAVPGGVAVDALIRPGADEKAARRKVREALEERNVPLRVLHLVPDKNQLRDPYPLRGDLRETSFSASGMPGGPSQATKSVWPDSEMASRLQSALVAGGN
jgi:phenylacetate-coenzyme A ligase PaaK-like adenylate-forming protein